MIIDVTLAERLFANEDPVGQSSVLFRPLPFVDPERLVQFGTIGVLEFKAYPEQSQSFEGLLSYGAVNKNLCDAPERIAVIAAERGLFDLLGVRPLIGRTFGPNDPPNVAVVSEGFWRRRYGGTPAVNDWKIVLDGESHTVVGIMPSWFQFPYRPTMTDVWIPWDLPRTENWSQRIDVGVGRVRPGVTINAALDVRAEGLSGRTAPGPHRRQP